MDIRKEAYCTSTLTKGASTAVCENVLSLLKREFLRGSAQFAAQKQGPADLARKGPSSEVKGRVEGDDEEVQLGGMVRTQEGLDKTACFCSQ